MKKFGIGVIIVLLVLCLTGLAGLGYSNWQLHKQIAALETPQPQAPAMTNPNLLTPAPGPGPQAPGPNTLQVPNQQAPGPNVLQVPDPDDFFSDDWDPFAEIEKMQEHMRQLMQQGAAGGGFPGSGNGQTQTFSFQSQQPEIDMKESKDAYVINVTIPQGSDIELNTEVDGKQFVVSGKVSSKAESGNGNTRQSIVSSSSFSRSFTLDNDVDTLNMKRETHGDTMVITLPKVG